MHLPLRGLPAPDRPSALGQVAAHPGASRAAGTAAASAASAPGAVPHTTDTTAGQPAPARSPSSEAPRPPAGLRALDTTLQGRVAGAQQALSFLDALHRNLQSLRSALLHEADAPTVSARWDALEATWQTRQVQSGGTLDAQLRHHPDGLAPCRFSIQGLNAHTLSQGREESLSLFAGMPPRRIGTWLVDPQAALADQARQLDRALAGSGLRASASGEDRLVLSLPEADWPRLRDTLAIQGEGIRFPSGQRHAVRTQPDADAIRVAAWRRKTDVPDTLATLERAQASLHAARQSVRQTLAAVQIPGRSDADTAPSGQSIQAEGQWARQFVDRFSEQAARSDFAMLHALSPALLGVSRQRVLGLLSLKD
ncbi:MAG: hypothetical protein QM742_07190 [Aquabacterium sp.]